MDAMSRVPSNRPISLGVIGAGKISSIILPGLPTDRIRVAALADVNREAAEGLAEQISSAWESAPPDGTDDLERPGVAENARQLLADDAVEAVYIATPPHVHADLIKQTIDAGKHVLCEKPWTMHAGEAREVANYASKHPELRVACCGSRFRFGRAAAAVAAAIPEIGTLRHLRMRAAVGVPRPLSELPSWKSKLEVAGGGMAADWGVYELEWMRGMLGDAFDPISVSAALDFLGREGTEIESGYHVWIRCGSGLTVEVSRLAEVGPRYHQLELRGERGGLDAPFAPNDLMPSVRLHRLDSDGSLASEDLADSRPDWPSILRGPFLDFAEAIALDRPVAADATSQIVVHRLLDCVYESARCGRSVELSRADE